MKHSVETMEVYLAVHEGILKKVFIEEENGQAYIANMNRQEIIEMAEEWEISPDSEKAQEIFNAEGEPYSLVKVNVPQNEKDDEYFDETIEGYSRQTGDVEFSLSEIRESEWE